MNDFQDIRNIVSFVAQIIAGAAIGYGTAWFCAYYALGFLLSLIVWFVMLCISFAVGAGIDYVVQTQLSNQRVERLVSSVSSVAGRISGLFSKKKAAA